jgi:hypothetical protein
MEISVFYNNLKMRAQHIGKDLGFQKKGNSKLMKEKVLMLELSPNNY